MIDRKIGRLAGMRDVGARDNEHITGVAGTMSAHLGGEGYEIIDTPLLEETELFVRKSGGELSGRLYTFTDPGGHRISLRPEFTSSVIRFFVDNQGDLRTPVRWQYGGPVFRYESTETGGFRQFTQIGAELIGLSGVEADAEIISLAASGLSLVGSRSFQLRIGHLGLLNGVLSNFKLSEPAKLFIIGSIHELKSRETQLFELTRRAEDVGLLRTGNGSSPVPFPNDMDDQAAQVFIETYLRESMPAPIGLRSTDHIVNRLLRKLRDANDPAEFDKAIKVIDELSQVDGSPKSVLAQGRQTCSRHGLQTEPFDELEALFDRLSDTIPPEALVTLDLGLARGISYYTGVIFELVAESSSGEVSLGGGGRYDGLVASLGGAGDVPALGFAYNMNHVMEVLAVAEPDGTDQRVN